ncbi:pyridoxal phosphate-dependent aminotransferase [Arcticibacterium luteifluviistationis]|uniref:Histidinol phosphate aminotransferase n=1 Tax=Arcticibacterium luteifluviistationis TaxID=1784714 RepID=A0A2Z4GDZ3_9BACT|nr:histidinol-phosphate transaminase [Arcticibacterium luteifluviistationis]AWV99245.1 histidinol phosphate aminotransferase [Arcticibacterium luteifluviistationis]
MKKSLNRRSMLKTGLMSIGGMALAPHIAKGAFESAPFKLDASNRLVYSPLAREYFVDENFAPEIVAKLTSNENPYGPPASAKQAVIDSVSGGNRYAWREMATLMDNIAEKEGVTTKHLMMGPGSSDLLEKVAIVRFMNGGNIVSADPTYMSLIRVAERVGATWKPVPCTSDWSHDLDAMAAAVDADTKLVYICNPNNPVGTMTAAKDLEAFCKKVSKTVPIFIDEAYMELAYGPEAVSQSPLVKDGYNVIVCRTFSKIMGMAGLRIGFMIAQPEFIKEISSVTRGGMGISLTSIHAATAAYGDDGFQEMTKTKNDAAKKYTTAAVKAMGYDPIPSFTNFMMFEINMNGKEFLGKMRDQGVGCRAFTINDKDMCRVSMGTMDEMKMFVSALKTLS